MVRLMLGRVKYFGSESGLYFIQTMRQLKVAPYITRSDSGTENVGVAAIQAVLHAEFNASDTLPDKHHQFVASTRNIKIEALWSRFLKAKGFTLMDTLKEGFEIGIYDPEDTFEYFLFLYIWIPLIQRYLTEYLEHCNSLRRQKTKNSILPTEKPNICFYNPLQFSGLECGFEVNESVLKFLEMEYCSNSSSLIYIPSEFKDSADLLFSKLQFGQYDVCSAWDVFTVMKTTWENI
ncbi:hypothetical protein BC833DRAFT_613052 [Globomyces pollinis-pini]|nr:hypothetical protein BC833DRAFT_613052 [Globomyces pollinis-pini]